MTDRLHAGGNAWNFSANVMDGFFYALALSLVSQQTVLPVYVRNLGGGNIAIGLIPVLWTFGFNFPQVFIVDYAQRVPRKKGLLLKTAIGQRLPWLLIAVASFYFTGHAALVLFFLLFALAAVGGSLNLPVWFDLIAKLTPLRRRGRLFAARSIAGAAAGLLGGGITTFILANVTFPFRYALLFGLAVSAMIISYGFLIMLKEADDGVRTGAPGRIALLHSLPHILRDRPNYRNYLVADALLIGATMANGFFTVHAFSKFSLTDEYAGLFTLAMTAGTIFGGLVFGFLADRFGHKLNLVVAGASTALACLASLFAPSVAAYTVVFVCMAFTVSLSGISRLPIIAELCTEAERPSYIALTNLVTSPFVLFGVLAGWLADRVGYEPIFVVAGGISLTAAFWLILMVKEPRESLTRGQTVLTVKGMKEG